MSTEYDTISRVYDALLYDVPGQEWADYLVSLLPCRRPMKILEYACGSGRLTAEFLQRGYSVIAVDRAEGMLTQAADKLRPLGRPFQLVCCDMTDFHLASPADAAICGLDAVNYLTSDRQLELFLSSAAANLQPGGVLLFDISTRHRLEHVLGNDFFYDDGDEQTLFWQNHFDAETDLLEMTLTVFDLVSADRYQRLDEQHVIRAWDEPEIKAALVQTGFTGVDVFRFGTEKPPDRGCERIQFRAVRA